MSQPSQLDNLHGSLRLVKDEITLDGTSEHLLILALMVAAKALTFGGRFTAES